MMGSNSSTVTAPIEEIGNDDIIGCMAISNDNPPILVTGSEDNYVRIWSISCSERTEFVGELEGHTDYITAVDIYGTFIVSASADGTLRKWDINTRTCLFIYIGHTKRISKIFIWNDIVFSTSSDKTARAWALNITQAMMVSNELACLRVFEGHARAVFPLLYLPNHTDSTYEYLDKGSGILFTGSADYTAKSWSFSTQRCLKTFSGHHGQVMCMANNREGTKLYTGSVDSTIRVWNIYKGECVRILNGHTKSVLTLKSYDQLLFSSGADGVALGWSPDIGDIVIRTVGTDRQLPVMRFFNGVIITGSADALIRVYEAKSGRLISTLKGHVKGINAMEIANGNLYSGSGDERLLVWNIDQLTDARNEIGNRHLEDTA